jgi:hypothetical protein
MSTVWFALLIWQTLMYLPNWSTFSLSDPNWLAFLATLTFALCAGGYKAIKLLWKHTIYAQQNFSLYFTDKVPPGNTVEPNTDYKIVPIGGAVLILIVTSQYGFRLQRFNVRCLNSDGTNASQDIMNITDVKNCFQTQGSFLQEPDTVGGIDAVYEVVQVRRAGSSLYFYVQIETKQSWSGMLTFRGEDDKDGFPSIGRHPIRII